MSFRPATVEDEELFFQWRQRGEAEAAAQGWWDGTRTTVETHHEWFLRRLYDATLLVWIDDGTDAGCVRIDSNGEVAWETTGARAVQLLEELKPLAVSHGGRLKFTVHRDVPSIRTSALPPRGPRAISTSTCVPVKWNSRYARGFFLFAPTFRQ